MFIDWKFKHPGMTLAYLGYLPGFLSESDPRGAKEQFNTAYISGWSHFPGFRLNKDQTLFYPGDPPTRMVAEAQFRDETIRVYEHDWVMVLQKDGSWEICRMD